MTEIYKIPKEAVDAIAGLLAVLVQIEIENPVLMKDLTPTGADAYKCLVAKWCECYDVDLDEGLTALMLSILVDQVDEAVDEAGGYSTRLCANLITNCDLQLHQVYEGLKSKA